MARIKRILNPVAEALSLPSRARSGYRAIKADSQRKVITTARAYKGAPDFIDGKPTAAFKYRTAANAIRTERTIIPASARAREVASPNAAFNRESIDEIQKRNQRVQATFNRRRK